MPLASRLDPQGATEHQVLEGNEPWDQDQPVSHEIRQVETQWPKRLEQVLGYLDDRDRQCPSGDTDEIEGTGLNSPRLIGQSEAPTPVEELIDPGSHDKCSSCRPERSPVEAKSEEVQEDEVNTVEAPPEMMTFTNCQNVTRLIRNLVIPSPPA